MSDFLSSLPTPPSSQSVPYIPPPEVRVAQANYASEFYERLANWFAAFDQSLDPDHEVGVRLVSFGQSLVFYLTDMGYWDPSLIKFIGETEDGQEVELIQHVSQISVLLMPLPKKDPDQPKRRLGFDTNNTDE